MSIYDGDINYSLIRAVNDGDLKKASELISAYGLSYSRAWSNGYVLLRSALERNHSAIAKLLLSRGCEVNSKPKNPTDTPLHFAAMGNDIEIIQMILNRSANVNARNKYGRTPLYYAIENNKMEITKLLLEHGASVNVRDSYDISPLYFAVERKDLQIVENGSEEIVTLLLSRGANVDVKGEDDVTPLHIAAKKGYTSIAEDLLNHGACIHSLTSEKIYTPLHFATTYGHKPVINLLLQHGAKIDNDNEYGQAILDVAVETKRLDIVEHILMYCPDINNKSNKRSLITAAYVSRRVDKKIIEVLLDYGFTVDPEDANNPQLLHTAVRKGYLKIVEDLLKYGADVNTLDNSKSSEKGFTLLHNAVKNKQKEVAKLLLRYDADINAQDETGKTPIYYSIYNANLEITKLLLTNGANVKNNVELLIMAVQTHCRDIVEALLEYNANVNSVVINDDTTPLHLSIAGGNKEIVTMLLNRGANVNTRDGLGRTALHIASKKCCVEVVTALLEYGCDINITDNNNNTPLDVMALIKRLNVGNIRYGRTAEALKRHIVKIKIANLYVSEQNLRLMDSSGETFMRYFPNECEEEIARLKSDKINNTDISFYDILTKGSSTLEIYMRNENIVRVLISDHYKKKYRIYTSMIERRFKKSMQRKSLLEQGNKIIHFLFNNYPGLPYYYTQELFSYLSDEDLEILIDACKPPIINSPNTNINDVSIAE